MVSLSQNFLSPCLIGAQQGDFLAISLQFCHRILCLRPAPSVLDSHLVQQLTKQKSCLLSCFCQIFWSPGVMYSATLLFFSWESSTVDTSISRAWLFLCSFSCDRAEPQGPTANIMARYCDQVLVPLIRSLESLWPNFAAIVLLLHLASEVTKVSYMSWKQRKGLFLIMCVCVGVLLLLLQALILGLPQLPIFVLLSPTVSFPWPELAGMLSPASSVRVYKVHRCSCLQEYQTYLSVIRSGLVLRQLG